VSFTTRGKSDTTWKNLLHVACAADPDAWRDKLRQVFLEQKKKPLAEFAASVPVKELPPSTLVILGEELGRSLGAKEAVALLRQAQAQNPGDFWINVLLARRLSQLKPPQRREEIRFL